MKTYYNILTTIKNQLLQDNDCNSVTEGSIWEIDLDKQTLAPLSHIQVNNATRQNNTYVFNITVYCMDIVDKNPKLTTDKFRGNDNEQDVLNTQLAVGARLMELMERGDLRTENFALDGEPQFESFTERFENFWAGWAVTFNVQVPNEMTVCDNVIPATDCADATYRITDLDGNTLYTGNIASGGSLVQEIQSSNVSNSNDSFSVNILSEQDLELGDNTSIAVNSNMDIIVGGNFPAQEDATLNLPDISFTDSDGTVTQQPSGVDLVCSGTPSLPSGTYTPTITGAGGFELPWTGKTANVSTLDGEIQHTGSGTLNGSAYCQVGVNGDFDLSFQLVGNNVGFGISYFKDLAQTVNQYYGIDFFVLKQSGRYYVFGNGLTGWYLWNITIITMKLDL